MKLKLCDGCSFNLENKKMLFEYGCEKMSERPCIVINTEGPNGFDFNKTCLEYFVLSLQSYFYYKAEDACGKRDDQAT